MAEEARHACCRIGTFHVDASVLPVINRGHTMAPVYMIAEKAADLITAGR